MAAPTTALVAAQLAQEFLSRLEALRVPPLVLINTSNLLTAGLHALIRAALLEESMCGPDHESTSARQGRPNTRSRARRFARSKSNADAPASSQAWQSSA